ncbi:unnamed protein product [Rhizoctonia solani]|uniref:Zn(2)-C6 fungal-type domain-containing protein n=1 Tax=Rhizoctonia solani TaxID=456999 RepID=A0A8H3HLP0_9AGAM|nr:unnamed protein product [Rhizoctonia solani]
MPSPSATPYAKPTQVGRSRSDVSLMRDKNGCITCRVRQKVGVAPIKSDTRTEGGFQKCSGVEPGQASCSDCLRLNIQCLGVSHNRPDWLRNPEALKETKYRIKHHLTEHPVPRGRGPAPKRPHLDFYDLIEKYSPRIPTAEEYVTLDRLQRMSPESPSQTTNYSSGYLSVQGSHYTSPTTPSPSSSYAAMPRTPTSTEGSLFVSTDMCNYPGGMMNQEIFYNQQAPAYVPQNESFDHLVSPSSSQLSAGGSPYRLTHASPDSLFLTSPISPYYYAPDYLSEHTSPSARRQ